MPLKTGRNPRVVSISSIQGALQGWVKEIVLTKKKTRNKDDKNAGSSTRISTRAIVATVNDDADSAQDTSKSIAEGVKDLKLKKPAEVSE